MLISWDIVHDLTETPHDDVIKWKHFPRNWPFVRGIKFPSQRPVTRSFDVFFDLRLNKRLSKQSWDWWFETLTRPLWRHCNENKKVADPVRWVVDYFESSKIYGSPLCPSRHVTYQLCRIILSYSVYKKYCGLFFKMYTLSGEHMTYITIVTSWSQRRFYMISLL